VCARLGLGAVLLLRTAHPEHAPPLAGNLLLDRLAGAELRLISPARYAERTALMAQVKAELEASGQRAFVIPEGGSNGLGALGYVDAMREVRSQLDFGLGGGPLPFDAIVHACGSGGTAAGVALGALRFGVGRHVHAIAVCDDESYFQRVIGAIVAEARSYDSSLEDAAPLTVHDTWKGPAYGVATDEQLRFIAEVARRTGLVLDPVYTGKALFGLAQLTPKPSRTLFIHTGGLPGLLAESGAFSERHFGVGL
jgi:D-cysteine desulfhydrase